MMCIKRILSMHIEHTLQDEFSQKKFINYVVADPLHENLFLSKFTFFFFTMWRQVVVSF